jgi:hypothetical protein
MTSVVNWNPNCGKLGQSDSIFTTPLFLRLSALGLEIFN